MNFSRRLAELLIRHRWALLALAAVLAAAAIPFSDLSFDRRIVQMFPAGSELVPPFEKLKRTFGGNEIVLAVYEDEDALSTAGFYRMAEVRRRLQQVAGVKAVATLNQFVAGSFDVELSVLRQQFACKVTLPEQTRRRLIGLFEGFTHGANGRTVAAICILTPKGERDVSRRQTLEELRALIEEIDPASGMITGEPVMVTDGFRMVENDGHRLGIGTTLLLALTIVGLFRSIRWVIIPIVVVQFTLLLTKAALVVVFRLKLSMVSSMLTAIVTVVAVATVIHFIVRFREARSRGLDPQAALTQAGTLLILPVIWACSTDAVGFLSLATASVGPVQDFGVMMAVGSLLVILSVSLLVPGLALLGGFDTDPHDAWGEGYLTGGLHGLVVWVERHPLFIGLSSLLVALGIGAGALFLEVESDFTKNFRSGSQIVRSYRYVEENLGGAGVMDVMIPAPQPLSPEFLDRVLKVEERLRAEVPELTKVISLADAVQISYAGLKDEKVRDVIRCDSVLVNNLIPPGVTFANLEQVAPQHPRHYILSGMREAMPSFLSAMYGRDPETGRHYYRIMLRAKEQQPSVDKERIIRGVRRIVHDEFPQAEVTGFFVLLTNLIDSMLRDQWLTFSVAVAGIGLMMLCAFRSLPLAAVALVPNIVPILLVMGLMGWLGLKINMGAAMIAAVSMGLSIDSSIHYITDYKRARRRGLTRHEAFDSVHSSVGRALVFSTLALIIGFSVLCFSQFVPTIYFGALVSLSMLGGLAGNLVVLPLLLALVDRDKKP